MTEPDKEQVRRIPLAIARWEMWPKSGVRIWQRMSPPQLFAGSFLLAIILGTIGIKTIPGLYTGQNLGWIDAFLTVTSAVCVTGLVVVDTATYFTWLGQAYILLLIQLGGLGMITFATLIIAALGRRMSLRHEAIATGGVDVAPHVDVQRLTRDVFWFTIGIEGLGAILLYALWVPRFGWADAAWPALFHSISAFCNAGFSTFSSSLIGFQTSHWSLAVIGGLIVAGGIGFLTLEELRLRFMMWKSPHVNRPYRLSIHSRIVLVTTGVLLVGGWFFFSLFEWNTALAHLPVDAKLSNGLFMSVTARTAGFNVIDYTQATSSSNFLTILLMSIGGSPGSTAGGLKTTTVALIGLLAWSRFRGHEITSVAWRSIPEETIQRAVGLFAMAFGLVTIGVFALTASEAGMLGRPGSGGEFLSLMFEAVSAFNTVGLSMNQTPELSPVGKWLVTVMMFLGRVGPLTFASAIALREPTGQGEFRYAYEDVVVG